MNRSRAIDVKYDGVTQRSDQSGRIGIGILESRQVTLSINGYRDRNVGLACSPQGLDTVMTVVIDRK